MELLEVGVRVLRRHWGPLLGAAICFQAIVILLDGTTSAHFAELIGSTIVSNPDGTVSILVTDAQVTDITIAIGAVFLTTLVGACFGAVAAVVYAAYVDADYRGLPITVGDAFRQALRRGPAAFVVGLLYNLTMIALMVGGAALALGCIRLFPATAGSQGGFGAFLALVIAVGFAVLFVVVALRLSISQIVVALEDVSPLRALRRGWQLTGNNIWRTFGLTLLVALVVQVITGFIDQILTTAVTDLSTAEAIAATAIMSILFAPVLPVMLGTLYFDLRVRREHFDLGVPIVDGANTV